MFRSWLRSTQLKVDKLQERKKEYIRKKSWFIFTFEYNITKNLWYKISWKRQSIFMKQIPDMLDDHHPRRNVHGHQLLEQQLGCVRKFHLKFNKKSQISRCVMKTINFISDQILLLAKKNPYLISTLITKKMFITWEICVLFLQPLHSNVLLRRLAMAIKLKVKWDS